MRTHYGTLNYTRSARDELARLRNEREVERIASQMERDLERMIRDWNRSQDVYAERQITNLERTLREVF